MSARRRELSGWYSIMWPTIKTRSVFFRVFHQVGALFVVQSKRFFNQQPCPHFEPSAGQFVVSLSGGGDDQSVYVRRERVFNV